MKNCLVFIAFTILAYTPSFAQDSVQFRKISNQILLQGECYNNLQYLCKQIGNRLSGTANAAKAVRWAKETLMETGADSVWLQPVEVPIWYRGKEFLSVKFSGNPHYTPLLLTSLGNSTGSDGKLLEAPLLMVNNIEELKALKKNAAKGKIVFFNFRFPQELVNTFEGYGQTARFRSIAPNVASAKGAMAIIIRSVSTGADDAPHTGAMRYADSVRPIPAVAIGNNSADKLEAQCKKGQVIAQLQNECKMYGTTKSYNVIAQINGTEKPNEIVLVGGHLDSWDVGEGAHDDGAGVVQCIEVLRTLKKLNIKPKRTIRAVLFMNEENGLKGGIAYGDSAKAKNEHHILAIETDAGGFSPRGFGMEMSEAKKQKIKSYAPLFLPYGVYDFDKDEGGADISILQKQGVPVMGLLPDPQRYFDVHHTNQDVFENINHRELKLCATVLTQMAWVVSEYGL